MTQALTWTMHAILIHAWVLHTWPWNMHAWVMPDPADLQNACMLGSCRPAAACPSFGCLAMVATMEASMDHAWEIPKSKRSDDIMHEIELVWYRRQHTTFCGIHGGPTCVSTWNLCMHGMVMIREFWANMTWEHASNPRRCKALNRYIYQYACKMYQRA